MKADSQTEAALLEMLERFCSGFAARDADAVIQLFAPDADVVMVTSEESLLRGPEEVRAFLQPYVQGSTTYAWAWDRRDVSAAGAVGWLLAEGVESAAAEGGEEAHPYRMSMFCEKRDGRWLLVRSTDPHRTTDSASDWPPQASTNRSRDGPVMHARKTRPVFPGFS